MMLISYAGSGGGGGVGTEYHQTRKGIEIQPKYVAVSVAWEVAQKNAASREKLLHSIVC